MMGQQQRSAVEILVPLGGGGMAEVYLGRARGDTGFEKLVAVKQLLPHIAMNTSYIEMLVDEARVAANLTHSNIGQVYDLRRDGDYIIMEFLPMTQPSKPVTTFVLDQPGQGEVLLQHKVRISVTEARTAGARS